MMFMVAADSVSPSLLSSQEGEDAPHQHAHCDEEEVDMRQALLDDPIVGIEQVVETEHGPGARQPRPLPSPKPMSAAQKAIHDLSHLPHDPACHICAGSR